MEPFPPLNKVFSMVLQHERQGANFVVSNTLVNAVKSGKNSNTSGPKSATRICSYCGKDHHMVDNGVPPHMKKSSRH
jgi:hypothetical protein